MAIEDWTKKSDGSLDLEPLIDARVACSPLHVFLRLQFARLAEGATEPTLHFMQMAMTPTQVELLQQDLSSALDQLRQKNATA
jgi:hypothetical protein